LIMGIAAIFIGITFVYPQYDKLLESIFLNGIPIMMFVFGAFLMLSGIWFLFHEALRYIKDENKKLNLFFIVGNMFNMIAAGLFAFAITINFSDLFMSISYTFVSLFCVVIASHLLLKSNKI
jgi:predicted phage tail protein